VLAPLIRIGVTLWHIVAIAVVGIVDEFGVGTTELVGVSGSERVWNRVPNTVGDNVRLVVGGECVSSSVGHVGGP
jgi:hypothetical protein